MRWFLLAFAGCGFSGPGFTGDGDAHAFDAPPVTHDTGDSPVVDAPVITPVDAAPPLDTVVQPVDTDGDGIPDVADNCPGFANPGQENEDGDKFGDACDPCPPVHDDNPPDADHDGVADACDPRPNTPGDRIEVFTGFAHGAPADWVGGGAATGTGTVSMGGTSSLGPTFAVNGGETVSASVSLASGSYAGIALAVDGNNYIECDLFRQGGFPSDTTGSTIFDGQSAGRSTFAFSADTPFVMTLTRTNSLYTCGANGGSGNTLTKQMVPVFAGIETVNGTGHFGWFMVVSHP